MNILLYNFRYIFTLLFGLSSFMFSEPAISCPVGISLCVGTINYKNGSVYVGDIFEGIPSGIGTLTSVTGYKYTGQFKSGFISGIGAEFTPNGEIKVSGLYDSGRLKIPAALTADIFVNVNLRTNLEFQKKEIFDKVDALSGKFQSQLPVCPRTGRRFLCSGSSTTSNGLRYQGEFRDDVFHGFGEYELSNANYRGFFHDGKFHGLGLILWKNGNIYMGGWYQGQRFGWGVFYSKSTGQLYVGDFIEGRQDGSGTVILPDRRSFVGHFLLGKPHGKGILYSSDGRVLREGLIEEGKFKKSDSVNTLEFIHSPELLAYYVGFVNGLQNEEFIANWNFLLIKSFGLNEVKMSDGNDNSVVTVRGSR